jgi:hypothetical protein
MFKYIPFALEENVLPQPSTPVGPSMESKPRLDFPLIALVSITGKRRKILTCTQYTTRAKLD